MWPFISLYKFSDFIRLICNLSISGPFSISIQTFSLELIRIMNHRVFLQSASALLTTREWRERWRFRDSRTDWLCNWILPGNQLSVQLLSLSWVIKLVPCLFGTYLCCHSEIHSRKSRKELEDGGKAIHFWSHLKQRDVLLNLVDVLPGNGCMSFNFFVHTYLHTMFIISTHIRSYNNCFRFIYGTK